MKVPHVYVKLCDKLKNMDENLIIERDKLKSEITKLRLKTVEIPIFIDEMEKLGLIKKINRRKIKLI